MPSTSNPENRPEGNHQVPRRGGRLLTDRHISIEPERRTDVDAHHLARALLRLAQEQYDARPVATDLGVLAASKAAVPPYEAHTGPNGAPRGTRPHLARRRPRQPDVGGTQ